MKFEPQKSDISQVAGMIDNLNSAQLENYSQRLGRTTRQLGEFILNHCDITEKERFDIEQYIRDLDNGRF